MMGFSDPVLQPWDLKAPPLAPSCTPTGQRDRGLRSPSPDISYRGWDGCTLYYERGVATLLLATHNLQAKAEPHSSAEV